MYVYRNCKLTCGNIVILDLRSCSPRSAMFCPSITMDPPAASMIRNRDKVRDDLPAPVRPTMPT